MATERPGLTGDGTSSTSTPSLARPAPPPIANPQCGTGQRGQGGHRETGRSRCVPGCVKERGPNCAAVTSQLCESPSLSSSGCFTEQGPSGAREPLGGRGWPRRQGGRVAQLAGKAWILCKAPSALCPPAPSSVPRSLQPTPGHGTALGDKGGLAGSPDTGMGSSALGLSTRPGGGWRWGQPRTWPWSRHKMGETGRGCLCGKWAVVLP